MDTGLIKGMIWRLMRTAIAAGVTQALILQPDWSNTEVAVKTLVSAFAAGFITALSLGIRDQFGETKKSEGLVNKLPV